MYNLDIIILTSIVSGLFITFLYSLYKEFSIMSKTDYIKTTKGGPRAQMVDLVGRLLEDKTLTKEEVFKVMKRTISDMESNGIYFSEDDTRELMNQID